MKPNLKNSDTVEDGGKFIANIIKVTAVLVASAVSSFFTIELKTALNEVNIQSINERVSRHEVYVSSELVQIKIKLAITEANQTKLAKREVWMGQIEQQLKSFTEIMKGFQSNRYTSEDANRDIKHIMREIDRILYKIRDL